MPHSTERRTRAKGSMLGPRSVCFDDNRCSLQMEIASQASRIKTPGAHSCQHFATVRPGLVCASKCYYTSSGILITPETRTFAPVLRNKVLQNGGNNAKAFAHGDSIRVSRKVTCLFYPSGRIDDEKRSFRRKFLQSTMNPTHNQHNPCYNLKSVNLNRFGPS